MDLINNIIGIGITSRLSPLERKKVQLLNIFAIVSISVSVVLAIVHVVRQSSWLMIIPNFIYMLLPIIVFYFNYQQKFRYSQYMIAYIFILCRVFIISLYAPAVSEIEYLLLLPGIASGFLFETKRERVILMIYCTFWFFAIKVFYSYYPYGILEKPYLKHMDYVTGGLTLGVSFIISYNIINNKEWLTESLKIKNLEVKNLNQTLEKKVAERTEKIELQAKALAQSSQEIKSFSHIAAHDMREPLRNIISFSQLINKDILKGNFENISEYSSYIDWSVRRIDALTQDIVDYTNLEQKIHQIKENDLNEILWEVIKISFQHRKDAIFEVDYLPTLKVNEVVCKMLFKELIENAVQYCDKPQPVIKVFLKEFVDHYQFSIQDNGIGIAKDYHEQIFKMFKRLNNSIQQDGSGIGLSICKKIIESYGGKIWAESQVGEGATFHFTLFKS